MSDSGRARGLHKPHGGTLAERLAAYSMPEPNSGCILWFGATARHGYGCLTWRYKRLTAHRASWVEANGPIPLGMSVLHKCDVRACINPAHLFLGTQLENMRDMFAKGRQGDHRKRPRLRKLKAAQERT